MMNWLRHNQAALNIPGACNQKPNGRPHSLFIWVASLHLSHSKQASLAYEVFLVPSFSDGIAFQVSWTNESLETPVPR